jgi:spore maturation protein CgeB
VSKVNFYLKNDTKREEMAKLGYLRCIKENKHKNRAEIILKNFEKKAAK